MTLTKDSDDSYHSGFFHCFSLWMEWTGTDIVNVERISDGHRHPALWIMSLIVCIKTYQHTAKLQVWEQADVTPLGYHCPAILISSIPVPACEHYERKGNTRAGPHINNKCKICSCYIGIEKKGSRYDGNEWRQLIWRSVPCTWATMK